MAVGIGFDVHRLVEGRALVLGGVDIPFEKGLLGHSDADVLTHAIMDALLGAAGLGDIGTHFPDTDLTYRGADSIALLKAVAQLIQSEGYKLVHIDATLCAERPKLAPHLAAMRMNLARALKVEDSRVHLKATTTEGLGFVGREEGLAALAVCELKETSCRPSLL